MKKHARQMCIRANARRKERTECITEYSCGVLGLVAFESCRKGRILVVEHYSTGVKMFEHKNYYNARGVSTVQTQSSTDYSQ